MSREGDHFQVVAQVLSSLLTVVRARDLEAAQVQAVEKSARTTADPRIACIEAAREDVLRLRAACENAGCESTITAFRGPH